MMGRVAILLVALASCSKEQTAPPPPPPASSAPSDAIALTVPAGWVSEPPANRLRKAQYRVPDKDKTEGDAHLIVTYLGERKLPMEENVSRWAGQVAGSEPKTETFTGRCKVTLVDLSGTYSGDGEPEPIRDARMFAAVVEASDGPWYFKLVGPAGTVGDWKEELVALLKAVHR